MKQSAFSNVEVFIIKSLTPNASEGRWANRFPESPSSLQDVGSLHGARERRHVPRPFAPLPLVPRPDAPFANEWSPGYAPATRLPEDLP